MTNADRQRAYRNRKMLACASPEARLIHRTKAILKANLREFGPRLDKILTKFEAELA